MTDRFADSLPRVLKHEGGYVNDPQDPGGETNKGITHRTYTAWQARNGGTNRSVKHITDAEVAEIYRAQYWRAVRADDLPIGVDYAVFDFAVNSGPKRAAQFLQRIVGVEPDGVIGAHTLAAVGKMKPADIVNRLSDNRLAWLKRLKTFPRFGRGWTRRVEEVRGAALAAIAGQSAQMPVSDAQGRADGDQRAAATVTDLVSDPKAWGGIGGLVASLSGVLTGAGPVQWAFAAVIVIGAVVVAYRFVKSEAAAR